MSGRRSIVDTIVASRSKSWWIWLRLYHDSLRFPYDLPRHHYDASTYWYDLATHYHNLQRLRTHPVRLCYDQSGPRYALLRLRTHPVRWVLNFVTSFANIPPAKYIFPESSTPEEHFDCQKNTLRAGPWK